MAAGSGWTGRSDRMANRTAGAGRMTRDSLTWA